MATANISKATIMAEFEAASMQKADAMVAGQDV